MNLYYMTNRSILKNKRIAITLSVIFIVLSMNKLSAQVEGEYNYYDNMLNSNMTINDASTPEVKQVQRYGLSDIKEYSGKIDLSIPIFTIKAGNISYPITLNYDSGGIKVSQEATNVGLGWNLSNSIIVRKIMGGQDWEEFGKTETEAANSPPYKALESRMGYFKYKATDATFHSKLANIDFFPDIFNVYIPSGNSSFYFENPNTPRELTVNEIKISSTVSVINFITDTEIFTSEGNPKLPTKDFFSFKITDANGLIYDFNDYDITSNLSAPELTLFGANVPSVSTWHISKITDPATNKIVEFIYEEAISQPFFTHNLSSVTRRINMLQLGTYGGAPNYREGYYKDFIRTEDGVNASAHLFYDKRRGRPPGWDYGIPHTIDSRIHNDTEYYKIKRIRRINFPEGFLTFEYDFTREDVENNNKALSKIKLFDYNDKLIKEFIFNYSYFNCNEPWQNSYDCKRLKLISVQENTLPPYKLEYIENHLMPRKASRKIDFLGFYNGTTEDYSIPQLYYYPNKGAWSILPFTLHDEEFYPLAPNSTGYRGSNSIYTPVNTLRKITFPTGGSEEYEYELNSFQIFGKTVNGGGLRIKKQILNDGKGHQTYINYQYLNDEGQSSGQLARPPMYGYPQGKLFHAYYELNPPDQEDPPGELITDYNGLPYWDLIKMYNTFYINDGNNIDADINNGLYIGYSHVNKIHSDGSYEKMKFTSRSDYPDKRGFGFFGYNEDIENRDGNNINGIFGNLPVEFFGLYGEFLQTNSNFEGNLYTDFSKNRGRLIYNQRYTSDGQLRKETLCQYEPVNFDILTFRKPLFSPYLNSLGDDEEGEPNRVVKIRHYGEAHINYQTSRFKPSLIIETEYLPTSSGNIEKVSQQFFTYLNQPPSNRTSGVIYNVFNENPAQNSMYEEVQYSFGYVDNPNLPYNNSAISTLRTNNNLNAVVIAEEYKYVENSTEGGFTPIQTKINKYVQDATTSNLPLIGSVDMKRGNNLFVNEASYKYDNKGNVIEYSLNNGTPVSIIWGYRQLYPIAQIEGIAYSSIPPALITNVVNSSNADNDSGYGAVKENDLRTKLNALRTHSTLVSANVLITTYTHDPLVGVTSITSPDGITGYYKYDAMGRLEKVIDQNGKELKRFDYNIPNHP